MVHVFFYLLIIIFGVIIAFVVIAHNRLDLTFFVLKKILWPRNRHFSFLSFSFLKKGNRSCYVTSQTSISSHSFSRFRIDNSSYVLTCLASPNSCLLLQLIFSPAPSTFSSISTTINRNIINFMVELTQTILTCVR